MGLLENVINVEVRLIPLAHVIKIQICILKIKLLKILPVSPSSSQMAMASWAVLYLTGIRRVLLVQKMSDSVREIFLMSEPVMFHTVLSLIRFPDGVGT